MKTSSRRLKPDSSQTHQHKTDRLTPDSHQKQTPPASTVVANTASFELFVSRVATVRTCFIFPYCTNVLLRRDVR
jgi:hypothetical protein